MATYEQVKQEAKTRLNEDWRSEVTIFEKYSADKDAFLQFLLEFEIL